MPNFKEGDKVRLKTGGPVMKVKRIRDPFLSGKIMITCEYDEAGYMVFKDFHEAELIGEDRK